ncbi:hypothetical protein CHCC20335_1705 [Bacillus paralicheniformis]|nr:hypothetical protein CHCC20335_1705 [Bacillus paralicheniformis]
MSAFLHCNPKLRVLRFCQVARSVRIEQARPHGKVEIEE